MSIRSRIDNNDNKIHQNNDFGLGALGSFSKNGRNNGQAPVKIRSSQREVF